MDRGAALAWVERVAKYCADQDGVPLIAGRVLGWLIICDPPEQSAAQIAEAIGASRASLTTNLRLLGSVGFLRQSTKPGDRTVYYRVDDDAWETVDAAPRSPHSRPLATSCATASPWSAAHPRVAPGSAPPARFSTGCNASSPTPRPCPPPRERTKQ